MKWCGLSFQLAFLLGAIGLLLSTCTGKRPLTNESVISDETVAARTLDCSKLMKENRELKEALRKQTMGYQEIQSKMATLQLNLVKKEIQTREPVGYQTQLQKKLGEAIHDVVAAKARLGGLESKADAASELAEVEVALKDLKTRIKPELHPEVIQAERLLKMSAMEFDKENYGGSLYLTLQVRSLLKTAEERLTIQEKAPVSFALPVPLRVLKKTNVREGPGLNFKIFLTLDRESPVTGHVYKDQWVQVVTEDGKRGWIFSSLLEVR
jgi:hypothetical protein